MLSSNGAYDESHSKHQRDQIRNPEAVASAGAARRISDAVEMCLVDEDRHRTLSPFEDVQELVRDATHLDSAVLIMRYPEHIQEIGSEADS